MGWEFFWHREIQAPQVSWPDVSGYSALPSHGTQESNCSSLMVMCEQGWQRTWWQDMSYPHTAPRPGRSLGNA